MSYEAERGRCQTENRNGVLCCYGAGHSCPCRFGRPRLTEAQEEILKEIHRFQPVRKFACIGADRVSTLKSLAGYGLVLRRYVGPRAWDASLTPRGLRVVQDLAR
jgi:hypothetical protein